jgi:hypothetical protein
MEERTPGGRGEKVDENGIDARRERERRKRDDGTAIATRALPWEQRYPWPDRRTSDVRVR